MGRVFRARHRPTGAIRAIKTLEQPGDVEAIAALPARGRGSRARRRAASPSRSTRAGPSRAASTSSWTSCRAGRSGDRLARGGALPWREAVALGASARARRSRPATTSGSSTATSSPRTSSSTTTERRGSRTWAACATSTLVAHGERDLARDARLHGARAARRGERVGAAGRRLRSRGDPPRARRRSAALPRLAAPASQPALRGRPARALAAVAGAPPALDALLDRALSPDEKTRPAAGELARQLDALAVESKARARGRGVEVLVATLALAGLLLIVVLRQRSTPPPALDPFPTGAPLPSSSPAPAPTPPRASGVSHVALLLDGTAPITSAEVSPKDLEAVMAAPNRESLLTKLVGKRVVYDVADLDPLVERAPASGALATLWAYAALASGKPTLREGAKAKLKAADTLIARYLVEAIETVDRIAEALEKRTSGGAADYRAETLANGATLAAAVPPRSSAASSRRSPDPIEARLWPVFGADSWPKAAPRTRPPTSA